MIFPSLDTVFLVWVHKRKMVLAGLKIPGEFTLHNVPYNCLKI